jgi:hypothetical protein
MAGKGIVRPSAAKAAAQAERAASATAKQAQKLATGPVVRVVLEVSDDTRHALKEKALQNRKTIRAYLLSLAQADGVQIREAVPI